MLHTNILFVIRVAEQRQRRGFVKFARSKLWYWGWPTCQIELFHCVSSFVNVVHGVVVDFDAAETKSAFAFYGEACYNKNTHLLRLWKRLQPTNSTKKEKNLTFNIVAWTTFDCI